MNADKNQKPFIGTIPVIAEGIFFFQIQVSPVQGEDIQPAKDCLVFARKAVQFPARCWSAHSGGRHGIRHLEDGDAVGERPAFRQGAGNHGGLLQKVNQTNGKVKIMRSIREIWSAVKRPVTREIPLDYRFGPGGGLAYELVLDSSLIMLVTDYFPSRLTAARQAAKGFVNRCAGHTPDALVGVVYYGDCAYVASGLVPVGKCFQALHQAIDSGGIEDNTNISAGLTKAGSEFAAQDCDLSPVIVLLTNGHWNRGRDPVMAASELKKAGIQIDIIGIGASPAEVNEADLKRMASVVNGQLRHWFIRDTLTLVRQFEALALGQV
jgi:hypothetical protein